MNLEDIEIPLETEDGMNIYHPYILFFRKAMLERVAKAENSDLYCTKCGINLPYNEMTTAIIGDGVDANFNPVGKLSYYCPLCEDYFYKKVNIE